MYDNEVALRSCLLGSKSKQPLKASPQQGCTCGLQTTIGFILWGPSRAQSL